MKNKVIFAVALTGAANFAHADITANQSSDIDSLRAYELQGVQVTATKATSKTPVAYSNISRKDLQRLNTGVDVPFLMSLTPSVTTTSDAGNGIGYTSVRVRGIDPSRINITANGVPMNDAESASLYWVNMGDFASSVENMQIQRGAGTSTNGAGAFGATVNMQTENIGTQPFFGIDLSGGSYYSHKETLRFGTGLLGGHWGIQGRLSNIGSKGYLDRASTKLNSYFLQAGYFSDRTMVKFVTFNGTEQTYHAWNYTSKYEQSLYGRTYNSCGEYYDAQGNVRYYDGQTDNYHQQNYQLILSQLLTDDLKLNATLHYTKGQGYYEEYKTKRKWADYGLVPYGQDVRGDLVRQKKMDNDFYGAIASLTYDNQQGLNAILGTGWNRYDGDHFGKVLWTTATPWTTDANGNKQTVQVSGLTPDFEYYRNNALKSDYNVYGKVNYQLVRGLSAYLDLQYRHVGIRMQHPGDWYGANSDGAYILHEHYDFFNPKFGLNYELSPNHRFFASYSISHKEPTRNDFEDNLGTELKAERLNDLELGYKYASPTFSGSLGFYHMNYRDQFVLTGELNSIGEAIARNVGKSYRTGIEAEASWKPLSWLRWDANATWSRNRAEDWQVTLSDGSLANLGSTRLSFSPDWIVNNILTFQYRGFNASVMSRYVSRQYLTNTSLRSYSTTDDNGNPVDVDMTLAPHFTTNIDLSYTFSLKKAGIKESTIGITLYNIFDKKYDNNGWAAPAYKRAADGSVIAYTDYDQYEAGFAPSAPFNVMAHLSVNF